MTRSIDKRFMISISGHLAVQISAIYEEGELNYSNLFCEAAQAYLATKSLKPQYVTQTGKDEFMGNPFYVFGE